VLMVQSRKIDHPRFIEEEYIPGGLTSALVRRFGLIEALTSRFRPRELRCRDIDVERRAYIDVDKSSLAQGQEMVEESGRWTGCDQAMALAKPREILLKSILCTIKIDTAIVAYCSGT
jgi:hypothetical protein